jgi:hypothetical protein
MLIPMPWNVVQNIVYTNSNNSARNIMLYHKEHMHLKLNNSNNFHFSHMSKKSAKKYGVTSMFGSLRSSTTIDTLFHHIPDTKDQTNVLYANVDSLIEYINYPDILSGHAEGCTCPYQRVSS